MPRHLRKPSLTKNVLNGLELIITRSGVHDDPMRLFAASSTRKMSEQERADLRDVRRALAWVEESIDYKERIRSERT